MFRIIKITFNAVIIVLALIGFNAIGGQKYVEMVKDAVGTFIMSHNTEAIKKIADFSKLNEEFQVEKSVSLMGYKAIIAEHKASGQKMVILDSGTKPLLTKEDIQGSGIDTKLKDLSEKFKYQGISVKDVTVTSRGTLNVYGQNVPTARFEAHVTKLPISEISGVVASAKTSDGNEKLLLSISDKKKYSQLITNEFFRGVNEGVK